MIIHRLVPKSGLAIVTPEDVEDLWFLRRLIKIGDRVSSETSRAIKKVGSFTRPDKGERIRVTLTLQVSAIKLDSTLERLRITGAVLNASNDLIPLGSSHSIVSMPGNKISFRKDTLTDLDLSIIKLSQRGNESFIVIAVDMREAGVGKVHGTNLHVFPTIYSGHTGKQYSQGKFDLRHYYESVGKFILESVTEEGKLFIVGPGQTKRELANYLTSVSGGLATKIAVLEGVDSAGEDGVYMTLRSPSLRRAVEGTKLANAYKLLEEVTVRISKNDSKVSISFNETFEAGKLGAIESALISDRIFQIGIIEDDLVRLMDNIQTFGGKVNLLDSSTDIGAQVSALGGAVALLRFPISK